MDLRPSPGVKAVRRSAPHRRGLEVSLGANAQPLSVSLFAQPLRVEVRSRLGDEGRVSVHPSARVRTRSAGSRAVSTWQRLAGLVLSFVLVLVLSGGAWAHGVCECAHGPEVACECPHHPAGRDGDDGDSDLPPCHRALKAKAKQSADETEASGPVLKVRCGGRAPAFVVLSQAVLPVVSGPSVPWVELPQPTSPGMLAPASRTVQPARQPPRAG